ncbi:carbohydrate porin [Saccharicrinis aurantiacus]|uniref:carbohydrate porin n=1 Tax=Saccharicrinis aurantiacus TaxID=1849719 RepID=UPI0008381D81|nr:carbohydrate porin [Saccharicrinis aurantiacus]
MKNNIYIICILFATLTLNAQEQEGKKSNSFVGPDNVERTLEEDQKPKQPFFELGWMQAYFGLKTELHKKTGINYGLDYSAAYFGTNHSIGNNAAGSGMVRLYGSWDLIGKGKNNTGAFIFKLEHRHKYTNTSLKNFGFQSGYVGMVLPPFSDDGFRMTNFYWRQRFANGKISMAVGLLDATDYIDVYGLASPWMHFTNFQFSTGSQTMFVPNDVNLGIALAAYLTENIYLIAGINDTNSDPTKPFKSFETFFSENQYFKSIELGWVNGRDRHYFDNIHVMYWHSDGSNFQASPDGWGLNFSGTWFVNDKLMPFLRGGYAEDGGSILQKSITTGLGHYFADGGHLLAGAIGWGEVNESTWGTGLDNQISMEAFFRFQISTKFALTPDVQFIINPALNSEEDTMFLGGIRARLTL